MKYPNKVYIVSSWISITMNTRMKMYLNVCNPKRISEILSDERFSMDSSVIGYSLILVQISGNLWLSLTFWDVRFKLPKMYQSHLQISYQMSSNKVNIDTMTDRISNVIILFSSIKRIWQNYIWGCGSVYQPQEQNVSKSGWRTFLR